MSDMDEAINEFLIESHENIDRLDNELLALEENPGDVETLASIFRTIHTIKGTCGFLGYSNLESVTHVGENLLGKLRDGTMALTEAITEALLHMVDAVREMLGTIEASGKDGDKDYGSLISTMDTLLKEGDPEGAAAEAKAQEVAAAQAPESNAEGDSEANEDNPEEAHEHDDWEPEYHEDEYDPIDDNPLPEEPQENQPAMTANASDESQSAPASQGKSGTCAADSTIRVEVMQLDMLMNLVGELVLARNQILQFSPSEEDTAFLASTQRLNQITTELQEGVMKTRMQPIGSIFTKYPRMVRDLAKSCGKEIHLEMTGKATELDKTILEAVKDPLTHIIRNSVDHGIETPDVREEAGKPREGRLHLRAFHEGGQVNIEIRDDGGGIPITKVKAKALQRGIITSKQVRTMSDHEALNLIFAPGFSTAARITNVSGRGVGMDVVRTNIENIGGSVDIQSVEGEGTTLRIKIPLTLAIIPALTITSSGQRFAIPQVNLLELVRLEETDGTSAVEYVHGTPVYRLRGTLLPLVYLNETLGQEPTPPAQDEENAINIVVLNADGHPFGLIVDSINDTEEIVVKPLDKQLKELEVYAGATIMGDGCVALILDTGGIARRGSIMVPPNTDVVEDHEEQEGLEEIIDENETLLLFLVNEDLRMAVPLSTVARLEEIRIDSVEYASGKPVTQYRGEIMPILNLATFFGVEPPPASEIMHVIVYQHEGRSIGFAVAEIQDIVADKVTSRSESSSVGVLSSAVIRGSITDILDAPNVIEMEFPELFTQQYA